MTAPTSPGLGHHHGGEGGGSLAIEIRGLTKRFGNRAALHAIDLEVPPGRIVGLIGPNGAGKTTTMRTLVDIVRPTAGTVLVLGRDPRRGGAAQRRRIGYLPGELAVHSRGSARRALEHYAALDGVAGSAARIDALADRLHLDLERSARALSKGNRQKIGVIQAFAHQPELLILDEPTSGLDPLVQHEFLALVREARNAGATVLLSSHVISEIAQVADDVAVVREGRMIAASTVARLRAEASREVRILVDLPDRPGLLHRLSELPGTRVQPRAADDQEGLVRAELTGEVSGFVAALSGLSVRDLVVQEPDLERAVLALYGLDDAQTTRDAP